ncbi:MAG: proline--tRNA ligase [Candidatus Methylacidiphilales bacterium]|nr:proline--tRNA ligase [Candidatus Methylacidiphilales bacterium]
MAQQQAQERTAITPTRAANFPEWYQAVVAAADMAENSDVRGCMVIKPWGYAIWELIQQQLDKKFKDTGHSNAYFPLFIPLSYMEKEAGHVAGFAKECAVVTHHRLETGPDGKLRPASPLTEPLIVRPTSETIIGESYSRWVQSYRDLPILLNQWANVVRWEMRPRLFLRTAEFLWQEGHTAHETKEEAVEETVKMLGVYEEMMRDHLALSVVTGRKSDGERFPGAVDTYCLESMVQDRKAVQAGTSHFLGQNFAKGSNIQYLSREGQKEFAWTTSWGVSTRLIGTLIMAHSDDDGLVLPPRVAPKHIVIIPVTPKEDTRAAVLEACDKLAARLREQTFHGEAIRVQIDNREVTGGSKAWDWIKKGVPIRVEIGPRDLPGSAAMVARRDRPHKSRDVTPWDQLVSEASSILQQIQDNLLERNAAFRKEHSVVMDDKESFYKFFTPRNSGRPEAHGGFALAHWDGSAEVEEQVKKDLSVTIRCIPTYLAGETGTCIFTGKPSAQRVVFAKSY